MNAIEARDLSKWFGEGEARTTAVRHVAFDAHFQEMLFIVGPSGSGKTTLLSMISGILRPNQGTVKVKGQDIWDLPADKLAQMRLDTIGFVFQDYHLFPKLTTVENVAVPLVFKRRAWGDAIKKALQTLERVGLSQRADLPPQRLSGGEQQRVAIARAMVSEPDILVLDEPTASLDGDTGRKIVELVKREVLNAQRCILIVTHDDRIFEFADRMIKMEDGKIINIEHGESHA